MRDEDIVELYWQRNENAIKETDTVYGRRLHVLSERIVNSHEDAQECVSDTYMKAWETIPPQRPNYFFAYLARICRNLSLDRLEWWNAAKRSASIDSLTQEMELCIPDHSLERKLEGEELGRVLSRFLGSLSRENRMIFMRRYWYCDSVQEIAGRFNISQSKVKTQLHRTRNKLKQFLEKGGICV